MLISLQKFHYYQNAFYAKVAASNYSVELVTVTIHPVAGSFDAFVGDSERTYTPKTFPCLFQKTVNPRQREKYGLPETINGLIYLSPKQLAPEYGTFELDKNKTIVFFEGQEQVIDSINYLERMYNSCVGIRLSVKDALKGG